MWQESIDMVRMGMILGAALYAAANAASAQGTRVSSMHADSSMTFHQYFEPFPRVDSAEACRDTCIANAQCTGWTWYEDNPEFNTLRRACILGAGLKDSQIGNRRGRTSGVVTVR